MAQRHATQSQAPPGQDAAAPSSKAFRKHTPCSPRELVAFQTYPLQTTWPLVITSLIMYCASWYAWHSRAKNDGDWMLTVMASMQSLSATFSWIHWLDTRAGWRAALDKIWARSECTCTYARPEARVAATSTRENTGNSTAVREKRGGSSITQPFTSSLSQVKSG